MVSFFIFKASVRKILDQPSYFIVLDLINRITFSKNTDHKAPRCTISSTPLLYRLFIPKYIFEHPFVEILGLIE